MKRNTFFSILMSCCVTLLFGQTNQEQHTDSILRALKTYEMERAETFIDTHENTALQKVFRSYYDYLKDGNFQAEFLTEEKENFSIKNRAIFNFIKAEYYKHKNQPKDSLQIYSNYIQSLTTALKTNDTILATTVFPKVLRHLYDLHETNFDALKKYSELYKSYRLDVVDNFWYYYYTIIVKLAAYDSTKNAEFLKNINFEQLRQLAPDDTYLQAESYQLEGIYHDYFLGNHEESTAYTDQAIILYSKNNFYAAQKRISGNKLNLAIPLFNMKKFKEAIPYFKKALERSVSEKKPLEEFQANEWLYKSYDSLQMNDSTLFYLRKMHIAKEKLKKLDYAAEVIEIENRYDFEDKEAQLIAQNEGLQNKMNILLPILGCVFLALIATWYLYKRYKSKSKTLESAQSETLEEIKKLKKIVIKNHIILKDKTKVYISDLMYIKSEDHYLRIYTNDTKNAFVRGKLSQIKEELPPNFIQSHRSYIINSNFIKQINNNHIILLDKTEIPLSRSHKNNFKD